MYVNFIGEIPDEIQGSMNIKFTPTYISSGLNDVEDKTFDILLQSFIYVISYKAKSHSPQAQYHTPTHIHTNGIFV